MKRILSALILSAALLAPTGCKTASTTPTAPPTLTQVYTQAAQGMQNFSADVVQAQQIEISLYKGGAIDQPTHKAIQNGFLQTATYGKQIDALIAGQASAATIQAKVSAALQAIQALTLATGTLDPNATAQLKATIQALTLVLNSVTTILSTTTTGELHGPRTDRNTRRSSLVARYDHLPAVQGIAGRSWIAG